MLKKFNIFKNILIKKNRQIREAEQRIRAEQSANVILSAYVAILGGKRGVTRIAKREVSEALGKYRVSAHSEGDDYVITVMGGDAQDGGDKRGAN